MVLNIFEALIYVVFSVSEADQQMTLTQGIGKNYILCIDKNTKYDKMVFRKILDRKLNGEYVRVGVVGTPDSKGIINAKEINLDP